MQDICKTFYFNNEGMLAQHVHAHTDVRCPKELTPLWLWNRGCLKFAYPPTMDEPSVQVYMKAMSGKFTMPIRENITFTLGDGVDDYETIFYGKLDDVNNCILRINYDPRSFDSWFMFHVRVDYMDEYVNNAPIIHIPDDMRNIGNEVIDITTPTSDEYIE